MMPEVELFDVCGRRKEDVRIYERRCGGHRGRGRSQSARGEFQFESRLTGDMRASRSSRDGT
jgi:hypothetical protein